MNKKELIEIFLEKYQPTILSIAEHWCSEDALRCIEFEGYTLETFFCRTTFKHGGVCLFVADNFPLNVKQVNLQLYCSEKIIESSAVLLQNEFFKCCVVSMYRSPDGDISQFFDKVIDILCHCHKLCNKLLVCGDLNIDFLKDSFNKKLLQDILDSYNLRISTLEPTRISMNLNGSTATKIDYIITNLPYYEASVVQPNIADHLAIVFRCNVNIKNTPRINETYGNNISYKYNKNCLTELNNHLLLENFRDIYNPNIDINSCTGLFLETLNYLIDISCPKMQKKTKNYKCNKNWITAEVKKSSESLKFYHEVASISKDFELMNSYKRQKKIHRKFISNTKMDFHDNLIQSSSNKNKKIWEIVNKQTGRAKKTEHSILKNDNVIINNSKEIAENFGKYFSNITDICLANHYGTDFSNSCTTSQMSEKTFFFMPIAPSEVIHIINNIKVTNSVGIDGLPINLFRTISANISEPLSYIINQSVIEGKFPNILKIAKIVPVYKNKGDKMLVENYRPISILTILSKILEKAISDRLCKFFMKYNLLSNTQHGFTLGKSTETASYSLTEFIYKKKMKAKK